MLLGEIRALLVHACSLFSFLRSGLAHEEGKRYQEHNQKTKHDSGTEHFAQRVEDFV